MQGSELIQLERWTSDGRTTPRATLSALEALEPDPAQPDSHRDTNHVCHDDDDDDDDDDIPLSEKDRT